MSGRNETIPDLGQRPDINSNYGNSYVKYGNSLPILLMMIVMDLEMKESLKLSIYVNAYSELCKQNWLVDDYSDLSK